MQPINGQDGRNVFPKHALVDAPSYNIGDWIVFTDDTERRIAKIEQTLGFNAQANHYLVTTTVLFDDDQSMWIMPKVSE